MPVRKTMVNWGEDAVPRYYPPVEGQELDSEALRQLRAAYARERDALLALQKAQRDRDAARFFKEEAARLLRLYRAADAWFKWRVGQDGWLPCSKWPTEIADEFDFIHGVACKAS